MQRLKAAVYIQDFYRHWKWGQAVKETLQILGPQTGLVRQSGYGARPLKRARFNGAAFKMGEKMARMSERRNRGLVTAFEDANRPIDSLSEIPNDVLKKVNEFAEGTTTMEVSIDIEWVADDMEHSNDLGAWEINVDFHVPHLNPAFKEHLHSKFQVFGQHGDNEHFPRSHADEEDTNALIYGLEDMYEPVMLAHGEQVRNYRWRDGVYLFLYLYTYSLIENRQRDLGDFDKNINAYRITLHAELEPRDTKTPVWVVKEMMATFLGIVCRDLFCVKGPVPCRVVDSRYPPQVREHPDDDLVLHPLTFPENASEDDIALYNEERNIYRLKIQYNRGMDACDDCRFERWWLENLLERGLECELGENESFNAFQDRFRRAARERTKQRLRLYVRHQKGTNWTNSKTTWIYEKDLRVPIELVLNTKLPLNRSGLAVPQQPPPTNTKGTQTETASF